MSRVRVRSLPRRLRALPLRWRLLAVALALILVALALSMVATSALLNRYLLGQAEQELRLYGASVARLQVSEFEEGRALLPTGFTLRVNVARTEQQLSLGEAVTERDRAAIPVLAPGDEVVAQQRVFTVGSVGGGTDWLALAIANTDRSATFVVALPLRQLDDTVDRFLWYAAGIGAIVLLACAALGWYLVRRAFRPLTEIEDTARAIAAGDLTRRVQEPGTDDEVASLSRSLNAMLARVEQSFAVRQANEARMRRFIADASHELRTPLAAVSGYAELYRQGALPSRDAVGGAMGRIEAESHRMSGLVEDLLTLARLDGERPVELQPVDLAVLAADAAQDARTIDPSRVFTVSGIDGPIQPTELYADERGLRQVVTNLVTNARVHTPPGTPVEVLVGTVEPGIVALHVRDHGPGIPERAKRVVFERFYRADSSRSRGHGGGNGLGLAIVAAIVEAHDGTVEVDETPGGGATFVVRLPTTPGHPPTAHS
ncbi:MAG TPA: HAMP domain-containing sensor histidine kinase [Intrasporangium sp.]|uniref:sensor histidine kinase n=1 Tax=Intrasporangium sp. TaxID=1925024 RepID=UPI002D797085|nr:HAMP domain-containing sensor histidine kinase [Intrasporangium sp.]HET7398791.1 HAMP domain-containing sensor histidine kinase [Intrasporangium sp.]